MKIQKFTGITLGFVVVMVAALSYSWTFTPEGRLDYQAAIFSKLSSLQSMPEDVNEQRELMKNFVRKANKEQLAAVKDYKITSGGVSVPVRVYTPKGDGPFPLLFEMHGGAWRLGDAFVTEAWIVDLAAAIPAVAVSVDYRLAPEHPYPAALDDSAAAFEWAVEQADLLGIDISRIAVGGASAGANLAAALTLKMRDEGGPNIDFQYLSVPVVDLVSTDWPSYRHAGDKYMLTVSGLAEAFDDYVPDIRQRHSPYVSPLLAASHANLPAAYIVTAQHDPLRDQGKAYAEKLKAAGVDVTYRNVEGAIHGFVGSRKSADRNRSIAVEKIREALYNAKAQTANREISTQ